MAGMDGEDRRVVTFGVWLQSWRQALDLSRRELGELVNCTEDMIRKIEKDDRRPSAALAVSLAKALGAPSAARERIAAAARGPLTRPYLPLPSLAVAMAAATPLPVQGPLPETPIIGRDRELRELIDRLVRPSTRLVSLTGPMGVGKTCLARAAAFAVQVQFVHGVRFVDLTGVADSTLAARGIAQTLGVVDHGPHPIERRLGIALEKQNLLLVLDGMEPSTPVSSVVRSLLDVAARLTVLVTSSRSLGLSGEVVVPIPPLAMPSADAATPLEELVDVPAVALFIERAQAVVPGFALTEETTPAVTVISRRLGGHPLAIELAAARLRVLSLDELADGLDGNLEAVLTAAWESLDSGQRRTLAVWCCAPHPRNT